MQCLLEKILGQNFCYGGTGMDVAFPGPNQGLVANNAKIRCFICQRITKDKYSGWKKALEGCGVLFHKKIVPASGAGARSAKSSYRNLMRQYKAGYPETHATIPSAGRKRKA